MMKKFQAQIVIEAPASNVWAQLTNFAGYTEWNPFLRSVRGEPQEGATITIQVADQPRAIKGKITQLVSDNTMQLETRGPLGLLKAVFTCEITTLEDGRQVKFKVSETFEGPLATILGARLEQQSRLYGEMCNCLKARVEQA